MKKVLQVVGEARAGKSLVCEYVAEKHGFTVVLISDIIRSFARDKQIALGPRADYLTVHAQMKQERGADYVARTVLARPEERICVDGIRVVNDVVRIQRAEQVKSKIVALHCPPEKRFERALSLKSPVDSMNYEKFLEDDERDAYDSDPERQNTLAVIAMADTHIDSSQPKGLVFKEIDTVVGSLVISSSITR